MAKYQGWKKRYSYLDDYKKGLDGKYVYYGRHHVFQGTDQQLRRYKWILGLTCLLSAVLFVLGGLMDAGAIWSSWYVMIPFALEVLAIFLLIWKTVTLLFEKHPVKSYIYRKTVLWFKPLGWIIMIVALLSICMAALCMILNPETVKTTGCILYMVLQLAMAALAFVFLRLTGGYTWEEDPSEETE